MKTILHSATLFAAGFLCCSLGQLQSIAQDEVRDRRFVLVDAEGTEVGKLGSNSMSVKLTLGTNATGQATLESGDASAAMIFKG